MVGLLLTPLAPTAFAQTPPDIPLTYAWPTPLTAQVTYTKSKAHSAGGKTSNGALTTLYTLQMAAPNAQGERVVSYSNFRVDPLTAPKGITPQAIKQVELLGQMGMPPVVINAQGGFVRLQDLESFRTQFRGMLSDLLGVSAQDPRVQRAVDQGASPQVLMASAANEWNQLVGGWAGGTLKLGQWYEMHNDGMLPVLPGKPVRMTTLFRIARELDCQRGGVTRKCVELERVTRPNPQDVGAAIEAFGQQLSGNQPSRERIEAIKVDHSMRLITEPQGLIPHQLLVTKDIGVTTRQGDDLKIGTELQEESVSFAY